MNVDLSRKMRGLDLFSGIGGISLALEPWVTTVAYCERDKYAQAVLLSRMAEGRLDLAPIWDDVRTLDGSQFKGLVDIIFGGFPCQNISSAGRGEGLEGDRSSLFGEIVRLAKEIRPTFIFLENVPAIRTRGLPQVVRELAAIRYSLRWGALSAFDVGAPHKRERWFCLAYNTNGNSKSRLPVDAEMAELSGDDTDSEIGTAGLGEPREKQPTSDSNPTSIGRSKGSAKFADGSDERERERELANSHDTGLEGRDEREERTRELSAWKSGATFPGAWESDAGILRVAHGVPFRVDRLRALGNSVVPLQVREAFKRLSGLRETNGESGR